MTDRWRTHVFGLALSSTVPFAGCPESAPPPSLPRVSLELADREALLRAMPARSPTVSRRSTAAGKLLPGFVGRPRTGYLLDAPGTGVFHVSGTGARIRCAARQVAPWRWQRVLVGQVLPLACSLRGFDPWHASAVALGDRAIALVGESGVGKSTLAAELILGGGALLADDVIALEPHGSGVLVHPGPGLMSLRAACTERLTAAELVALGTPIGRDRGAVRLATTRREQAVPLAAVYLLEPADDGAAAEIRPEPSPDPRLLLASTFIFAQTGPSRAIAQLEACATVARTARVVRVRVPRDADHRALAGRLQGDAAASGAA